MNKTYLLSMTAGIILVSFINLFGEEKDSIWLSNLSEAQQQAKDQDKKILMYFSGSDWCLPCMQLKIEVFDQQSFKSFANKHLIPVAFDFPARQKNKLSEKLQKYNDSMAEKYNEGGAFPLILVLNEDGSELGKINGYAREGLEEYINKLNAILKQKK